MHSMRTLTVVAVAAGAAAEAGQWGHVGEPVYAQAVAPRDSDCTELLKLCTDPVLLRGYETTLTYLCPVTEGPSTVTITMTATTTVTAGLTSSVPAMAISDSQAPATEEPTTTVTVKSTAHVTITRLVTKVANSPSSSSLTPPSITWSYTAVLPSHAKLSGVPRKSLSTPPIVISTPVSSADAPTFSASSSFVLFPSHTVSNSSSIASTSSAATSSWVGVGAPFSNHTDIHALSNLPTWNLAREAKSTEAVTTESKKGLAGDTQASFIALFFGVLAATLLI